MSLETLLQAAQFLEYKAEAEARGEVPPDYKNFAAFTTGSTSCTSVNKPPKNSRKRAAPLVAQRPRSNKAEDNKNLARLGNREAHNRLEKNRRAQLKERFDALRRILSNQSSAKMSNLNLLTLALKRIKELKKTSKDKSSQKRQLLTKNLYLREIYEKCQNLQKPIDEDESTVSATESEDAIDIKVSLPIKSPRPSVLMTLRGLEEAANRKSPDLSDACERASPILFASLTGANIHSTIHNTSGLDLIPVTEQHSLSPATLTALAPAHGFMAFSSNHYGTHEESAAESLALLREVEMNVKDHQENAAVVSASCDFQKRHWITNQQKQFVPLEFNKKFLNIRTDAESRKNSVSNVLKMERLQIGNGSNSCDYSLVAVDNSENTFGLSDASTRTNSVSLNSKDSRINISLCPSDQSLLKTTSLCIPQHSNTVPTKNLHKNNAETVFLNGCASATKFIVTLAPPKSTLYATKKTVASSYFSNGKCIAPLVPFIADAGQTMSKPVLLFSPSLPAEGPRQHTAP